MNERNAIFRSILDAPDDDVPRLVFADWLEENGDEDRAEFVRVQCALARRLAVEGVVSDDDAFADLWERQRELLWAHRSQWVRDVPTWALVQFFRRGFVAGVSVTAERWLDSGETLRDATPLEQVAFTQTPRFFDRLLADEGLRNLTLASFAGNGLSVQHMRTLTRSHALPRLRGLSLSGNLFGAVAVGVLAQSAMAPRLEHLDLSNNTLGDDGLFTLAQSPGLANLRTLQLLGMRVSDAAVLAVADSPHLKRLTWLRVGDGISRATRTMLETRFTSSTPF